MALQTRGAGTCAPVYELATLEPPASTSLLLTNLQHSQACQAHHIEPRQQPHAAVPHQQPHLAMAPAHSAAATSRAVAIHPPPRRHPAGVPTAAANRLNAQLQPIQPSTPLRSAVQGPNQAAAPKNSGSSSGGAAPTTAAEASWRRRVGSMVLRVGDMLQPQGEAPGDATWGERTANVLTSLPFLALGLHMHRQRLTPEGRAHALSMVAVGAAATAYHATSGTARRIARKIDYWTIAVSSASLVKCLHADNPAARRAANLSLLAVPFKPFAVSVGNALAMQAEYARQATKHKAVRTNLARHYTAAALGLGAFFAEDLVMDSGWGGFVHSAWHCLACYGVYSTNGLLAHCERQRLQRQLAQQGAGAGIGEGVGKPLRRPVHSSASSLPSYGGGYGSMGSAKLRGPEGWSPGTASP